MNEQEKFNLRLTFFLSLGFFLNMMAWTLYDAQVPITLDFIKIGLILFAVGMMIGYLFQTPMMIIIGFIIAGIGFAFVNTLAVVVLWELVPTEKRTGTFTGIYFLAIFCGAIFGPVIVGFLTDILGNVALLLIISIFI